MNWKNEAINDLTTYEWKKESLQNIWQQIEAINLNLTAVKGTMTDITMVKGGESKYDERLLNDIVKRDRLKLTYCATEKIVKLIEKGLNELNAEERFIIDKFYIHRAKGNVGRLMDKLGYEKSRIYEIKDKAVYKFTVKMYGIKEY